MQTVHLEVKLRPELSKGQLNALRAQGWIPAILYGAEKKERSKKTSKSHNILLQVNEKSFLKMVGDHKSSNIIIELKWDTQTANAIIKEVQHDFIKQKLLHIDFKKISLSEKIEVSVPVHLKGEAPGVKLQGGTLEYMTREIKIQCLPQDIPSAINVDISKLEIGQGIHIKEIPILPGVTIVSDPNLFVVHVLAPTKEEVLPAAGGPIPGTAEPEVIAKGKKPEEGATPTPPSTTPASGGAKAPGK